MGSARRLLNLSDHIAASLNRRSNARGRQLLGRRGLACTGAALLAMHSGQIGAVGLGDIKLQSGLGQPLRATVPVTIGTGESTRPNCVRTTDHPRGDLSTLPNPSLKIPAAASPGTYNLRIETASPLYEPMYELSLMVDCPGTALLVRHYVLMLDLPGMPAVSPRSASPTPAPAINTTPSVDRTSATPTVREAATQAVEQQRTAPRRARSPIQAESTYQVQSGDTLSTIAARIEGRPPNAIWDVAMQIFARNPEAFIRANPDLIKLGHTITIPSVAQMQLVAGMTVEDLATATPKRMPPPAPAVEPNFEAVTRQDKVAATPQRASATEVQREPAPIVSEVVPAERSPFADETPDIAADTNAAVPAVPTTQAPVREPQTPAIDTVVTVADDETSSGEINPFVAIILGLLLGLALSLLIARSKLIEIVTGLVKRDEAEPRKPQAAPEVDTFNEFDASVSDFQGATMNDFDDKAADAAFATGDNVDPDATPVQFGTPAEDTYIVEVSEAEQTLSNEEKSDELFAPETGVENEESLANIDRENVDLLIDDDNTPDAMSRSPEDTMLSQLFDEDLDPDAVAGPDTTSGAVGEELEPTAEMPGTNLEPTAEMPVDQLEPTAEMPGRNLEPTAQVPVQNLEPTAEIPVQDDDPFAVPPDFIDPAEVIDPTAEPTPEEIKTQMSMTQSFSENLERLDQMRASEKAKAENQRPTSDSTTSTLQIPSSNGDAMSTAEINLEQLVKGAAEDETLSQTLHEALSLLERDYEDEFTASQIIERQQIEKDLQEDDDDDTIAARKVK